MRLPKRTRSHILETESEKALMNLLPNEWVVEKKVTDYGVDHLVEVYENGTATGIELALQIKGHSTYCKRNDLVTQRMKVSTLNYLIIQQRMPILITYESGSRTLNFLFVRFFVEDVLPYYKPSWRDQNTVMVYLPYEMEVGGERGYTYDDWEMVPHLWKPFGKLVIEVCRDINYANRIRRFQELVTLSRLHSPRAATRTKTYLLSENDPELLADMLFVSQGVSWIDDDVIMRLKSFLEWDHPILVMNALSALAEASPAFFKSSLCKAYTSFWERYNTHSLSWEWEDTKNYLYTLVHIAANMVEADDKVCVSILLNEFNDPLRNWIGQEAGRGLLKALEHANLEVHNSIRRSIIDKCRYLKDFDENESTSHIVKHVMRHVYSGSLK